MRRLLALLLLAFALPAAASDYFPTIYPLRDGLIPKLNVAGPVSVINGQPSKEKQLVYKYSFAKLYGTMNDVTQTMVDQTRMELGINAAPLQPGDKTIELRVDSLLSKYSGFFSWKSKLVFEAKLGDGTVISKEVPHASGVLVQDLNGAIAESVMVLLNDPQVRAYVESTAGATAPAVAAPVEAAPAAADAPATDDAAQPAPEDAPVEG